MRIRTGKRAVVMRFLALAILLLAPGVALLAIQGCRPAESPGPPATVTTASPEDLAADLDALRRACEDPATSSKDPIERSRAEAGIEALLSRIAAFGPSVGEPLRKAVLEAGAFSFRSRCFDALASAASSEAKDLARALLPDPREDPLLRVRAAGILLALDPESGASEIADLMRRENEQTFVPYPDLVDLLAGHGGPDAERALLSLLDERWRGTSSVYRAVQGLGRMRARSAARPLRSIVLGETVDHFLRRKAVQALHEIEGRGVCPFLEACLADEHDAVFRAFLEDTLARRCR